MKYLLLLTLFIACGKHEMPQEKDLGDNDGDGQRNAYEVSEFEKNVADLTKIGLVKIDLKSSIGSTGVQSNSIELENKMDLSEYTRNLMVNNLPEKVIEDYFSEFTILRVKRKNIIDLGNLNSVPVKVKISHNGNATKLSLLMDGEMVLLGPIQTSMELDLSSEVLKAIADGKAHLVVTNEKTHFIKERTYRVYKADGVTTNIYYVSKSYPINKFLKNFNIDGVSSIEGVSLLTTTYASEKKEWWIRHINGQDIVLVKENLQNLAAEYLKNFSQEKRTLSRLNGSVYKPFTLTKPQHSKGMLKFRIKKYLNYFATVTKKEKYCQGSNHDGNRDCWTCKNSYRSVSGKKLLTTTEKSIDENVGVFIDINWDKTAALVPGSDKTGYFLELNLPTTATKAQIDLNPLSSSDFVQVGLYASSCKGDFAPKIKPNLVPIEASLEVEVEAFVEKI